MMLTCRRKTSAPLQFHILRSRKTKLVKSVSAINHGIGTRRALRVFCVRILRSTRYLSTDALAKLVGTSLVKVIVSTVIETEATMHAVEIS